MLTVERLDELTVLSDFDSLVGEVENDWFECKGQPYQLKDDSAKRELAKDVSSFANHKGGFIFIGVRTKQSSTHYGDEVEEIRAFQQGLLDVNQYHNVIRDWVYPEIEGITIRWAATKEDATKGVVIIYIPEQRAAIKPFLIKKVLDEKKQVEIVFGYVERRRDTSQPLSVVDLQRALRSGLSFENSLTERLDSLEALVKQLSDRAHMSQSAEALTETIDERIGNTLAEGKIAQSRAFILAAYPRQPNELKTIFQTSEGSILKHLENPPTLRHGGWGLHTFSQPKIMRGEFIRVGDINYKVVDLYRDGTMILAVVAGSNFLAWGRSGTETKINPLSLVEVVYNFFSLYCLVINDLKNEPQEIMVRADFNNLHHNGEKTYLVPHGVHAWTYETPFEVNEAPEDCMNKVITLPATNFSAGAAAFTILREIYLWFGLSEDKIPYAKVSDGGSEVDPEQITQIR
jgi:hypothetical protein